MSPDREKFSNPLSFLEDTHENYDRIVCIQMSAGGNYITLWEACDEYFNVDLNKAEVLQLAETFKRIAESMV